MLERLLDRIDNETLLSLVLYSLVYLFTVFCYKIFAINQKEPETSKRFSNNILWLFLATIPMTFLYGLRYEVGFDYDAYVSLYNQIKNYNNLSNCIADLLIFSEPLYTIINYIFSRLFADTLWLFLFIGLLINCFFTVVFYKLRKNINLPFAYLLFYIDIFFRSTNLVRFGIACSITFLAIYYLYRKNVTKFLTYIIIASLFQKSVIVCILFLFLQHFNNEQLNKYRNIIFYITIMLSPVIIKFLFGFIEYIPILSLYTQKYSTQVSTNDTPILAFVRILPILLLLVVYRKKLLRININNHLLLNIYFCKIPFIYAASLNKWAGRLQTLSELASYILIPMIIYSTRKTSNKLLISFLCILYYICIFLYYNILQNYIKIFPYHSIIITFY